MNIIGCLDVPTSGQYLLNGEDVSELTDDEQAEIRNKTLGFIFQQYNLIPKLNVQENVELSLLYAGIPAEERAERARLPDRTRRTRGQREKSAHAAFRRPAAARFHRTGAGRRSFGHPGRRADRRARFAHQPRGAGFFEKAQRRGQYDRAYHA